MDFSVHTFVGWQWTSRQLRRRQVLAPPIETISSVAIDIAGSYAGSYHVLELGQHFEAYTNPHTPRAFNSVPQLPNWVPADPLLERNRAADITGNIGEIIAGILAMRVLGVPPHHIVHLRARKKLTPDYLLHDVPQLQAYVSQLAQVPAGRLPEHWPVESKAGIDSLGRDESEKALRQLVAYWIDISRRYRKGVGYGIVVTTELTTARITVSIIMPLGKRRARQLRAYLRAPRSYERFCRPGQDLTPITACLRGLNG
jgi:hypothetical protein